MLEKGPVAEDIAALLGPQLYNVWKGLCTIIDEKYEMEHLWNNGGKAWTYEYKYRRGGKTLCTLYAREKDIGFLIIFGKEEREKFEVIRKNLSEDVQKIYDEYNTYHDGKWMMYHPVDSSMFGDFLQLLAVKRRPNRKAVKL